MTKKDFFNAYGDFMVDVGFSKNSIAQYKSYLNNACAKLPGIKNHIELIAASENPDEQSAYAEAINAAITKAMNDEYCTVNKKKLYDYKSATVLLVAFLSGQSWVKNKGVTNVIPLNSDSEYSKNDIKKVFLSRLKTQDRMSYSYGVFAARVLCKIATRNKVKIFDAIVDDVKFLYAPDLNSFFYLKDIEKFIIATDGYAYILKNKKLYPVYTEIYKNGNFVGFEKAKVTNTRDLSLDHDIPMVKALEFALGNMPEYKKLSDDIMRFKSSNPKQTASDISTAYFTKAYPQLNVCEKTILKEMSNFLNDMQLTIMYTPYNSSKSGN